MRKNERMPLTHRSLRLLTLATSLAGVAFVVSAQVPDAELGQPQIGLQRQDPDQALLGREARQGPRQDGQQRHAAQ